MADNPAADRITVRHKGNGEVIDIARTAAPFFPDYEQIDSQGRRVPEHNTSSDKKKGD